jgi:hypothetical protein
MHLYEKWSKYAFAYVHMQMHNYPKPIDNIILVNFELKVLGRKI